MTDNRKAACVVGWPASHSRSPLIHQFWMRKYGIDAEYRKEAIPPDQFADFIGHLRERGYAGCNVTVPHKQAAMELTIADDRARAVGAANTLWFDGDKLRSTNTDVEGFLANLDQMTPGWGRGLESAVVLGAGGGARAVVYALLQREVQHIHVVNRSPQRAEALREQFGSRVRVAQWSEMTGLLGGAGLLVNTTSLGMVGQPKIEINLRCQPSMVVADLVYVPLETGLLAAARDKGLRTADGLGMLLHQAVRGFELWFGVKPEVTPELRKLIEDDLIAEGLEATAEAKAAKEKQKAKAQPKVRAPKMPRPPKNRG